MSGLDCVVVAFRRPELTRQVLERVLACETGRVWVAVDGPRDHRDEEGVSATRAVAESFSDPRICLDFSDENLGLRRNVERGVDRLMGEHGRGVILEDDTVPEPTLFAFHRALLDRYADDERIGAIAGQWLEPWPKRGQRPPRPHPDWFGDFDHGFSPIMPSHGWATWKRAWDDYPRDLSAWPRLRDSGLLERQLGATLGREWTKVFGHLEHLDSYWLRFSLSLWLHNRLAVIPRKNMVHNTGVGHAASTFFTRGSYLDQFESWPSEPFPPPYRYPPDLSVRSAAAEQSYFEFVIPFSTKRRHLKRMVLEGPLATWAGVRRRLRG